MQVDNKPDIQVFNYGSISFILTDKKTAVATPLQFFILLPSEPYYTKRMRTVRLLISLGQIKSLSELAEYSQGKIEWRSSREEWL